MMLWLENLLSDGMVERLGWMLVHFLWQAAVVAVLLAVFLRLLRRSNANARYLTACSALMLMVVLPVATMQFIEVPGPAAEAGPEPEPSVTAAPPAPATIVQMPEEAFRPPGVPLEAADVTIAVPWGERITAMLEPALPYAVLGWLVGVFGLSAWHLGGWMQLQRLKRRMVRGVGETLQRQLVQIAGRLRVHRAVTLLESALVEVPTVVGWLRPVILLPASALTGLAPEQLEAILAHELAHIRRYDYLVNVVQTVVEILGFYHPAVWWVSHRIRVERENCCDDAAVRLCGDSVRYARALTCLEEIRHSQAELAMAATGGSLLGRIARLLGRPAADDRRFTWLPGLIALLLVVGIVIPAALALAAAGPDQSEPPSGNVAASTHDVQDIAQTNEPNRPPVVVMLDFYIAEAFADAVLDQDTATKVAGLLARIPVADARRPDANAPPSLEELQQPLADVLAEFAPKPGKSRYVMDWLVSRGYAQVVCNPRLEMFTGEQGSIAVGDTPDPNAAQSENRDSASLRLSVTPNEIQDQNATRLDIDFVRTYSTYTPGDPNKETTTSAISATLAAPNDRYTSITDRMIKRVDENGRERLLLAFVRPAVVPSPDESPSGKTGEAAAAGAEASGKSRQILLNVVVAQVASDQTLDRDTAAQARALLANATAKAEAAMPPVDEFRKPLRQIIAKYLTGRDLAGESLKAFTDLLVAKGYAEVLTRPTILTREGEHARLAIGEDPNREASAAPSGTDAFYVSLEATPTIQDDPNTILLSMGFHMENVVLFPHVDDGPIIRAKAIDFRAPEVFHNNEYRVFPLPVTADTGTAGVPVTTNMLLLLVKATVPGEPRPVSAPSPNVSTVHLRAETGAEPNANVAHVLVKARIIEAADGNRPDRETMIQIMNILGKALRLEGPVSNPSVLRLTVGEIFREYVVEQPLPNEKVEALVELLASKGYLKVLAEPEVVAQDGKQCQIKAVNNEYFWMNSSTDSSGRSTELQKVDVGTTLDVTPHVKDPNTIFMEIRVELSDIVPGPRNRIPPVISRRTVGAAVTTLSGRYITLAGMTAGDASSQAKDGKSLYIMAMPFIIPHAQERAAEAVASEPTDTVPRQVRLDVRTVATDRDALQNLGVEWARPTIRASTPSDLSSTWIGGRRVPQTWAWGTQVAIAPDRRFTESLLTALDMLQKNDQADDISSQHILAQDGRQAQIKIIREEWPTSAGQKVDTGTALSVIPRVGDGNDITLDIAIEYTDILPRGRGGVDSPMVTTRTARNSVVIRDGGTVALAGMVENRAVSNSLASREIVTFVTAHLVNDVADMALQSPQSAEPPVRTEGRKRSLDQKSEDLRAGPNAVAGNDKGQVVVECCVADVASQKKLDRKTADEAAKLLAQTTLKPAARDLQRPLGEILQQYTENHTLSGRPLEAFVDLLVSRGYAKRVARPTLLTLDNQPGQIEVSENIHALDDRNSLELTLGVTPKSQLEKDLVFLELHLEAQRQRPGAQSPGRTAHTVVTSVLVKNGQSIAAPKTSSITWHDKQGNERMLFTVVRPSIVPPPPVHQAGAADRQVFLEIRTVAMQASDPSRSAKSIRQVLVQDGVETRIIAFGRDTPEQSPLDSPEIEKHSRLSAQDRAPDSGIVLSVTPHTQSTGDITFDIAAEVNYLVRPAQRSDPPIARRRTVKNTCRVQYGGTVLAVSLKDDPTGFKDEARREVGVFVTAQVALADGAANSPEAKAPVLSAGSGQGRIAAPPSALARSGVPEPAITATFTNADLRDILAEISKRSGVSVAADETVKPRAITTELAGASVEESLRRILEGTPYVFRKIGETTNARKQQARITNMWQGDQLRVVLQDIAAMAGVTIITDEAVVGTVYADTKDVSLETALEMVLAGKPYAVKKTPDYYLVTEAASLPGSKGRRIFEEKSETSPWAKDAYLVYRPISNVFTGEERRQALMDLAAASDVSIAVDENITGEVYAELNNVTLETALEMVTAGTSYVVEKKADHYEVTARKTPAEPETEISNEEPVLAMDRSESRAWTIMRQWNCPPLLLGLTQQFAKVLQPSRRDDPVWRQVQDGGTLRLRLEVEGGLPSEVVVGLFKDARWLDEPVAVRRLPGAGTHTLTGLPAGRYEIGAMIGNAPVPVALGVQRAWPEAIEIGPNYTATADVLVSEAFQKHATGAFNDEVAKDYFGQWDNLNEASLLQGQLTGPDGKPVRFGYIQIREHNPGARSIAAPDRGTDEQGIYRCDEIAWPYRVNAAWREAIPSTFGCRSQWVFLSRVLQGPQRLDFRFKPFPEGTAKVAGRVIDQKGQPVKSFFLRVLMPPFDDLDLSNLTGQDKTQVNYDVPFISDDGRFELSGLPAGRATLYPIPFETQRYEHEWGQEVTLEAGKTTGVEIELVGKSVFYGRVLFEDGTPAVITPAPWREAATRILMPSGGRTRGLADVEADGYFTLDLDDSETEALALGNSRLQISVPTDQERRANNVGEFPYEKLAKDRSKAGTVTVKRPLPTPTLPPQLRQGGPLPPGWSLSYQEPGPAMRRTTHPIVYTSKSAASDSQPNPALDDERFALYSPDGKCAVEFTLGSVFILDKAQPYTLLSRPAGDKPPDNRQITRGPFILDLTRPGQYTLTVDPSATSRPVLLDTRTVAMERRDMQHLGIEWTQENTGHIHEDGISDLSMPAGRLFDRVSSDLLLAELDRLEEDSRLDIIASPQVRAREGHESRVEVFRSPHPAGRDDSEWPFDILVTPSVGDSNDISLELAYDVTRGTSLVRDANHQAARPDRPRNTILVHDGGTVALAIAGLTRPEARTPRVAMTNSLSWLRPHLGIRDEDNLVFMVFIKASLTHDPAIE
jgi:type II secretory pathway component GspD/PulD (secretin)/beta-lactamase regulating signal transducer with metallopeptidase domain